MKNKYTGLELLKMIVDNELECHTLIRCKNKDISSTMEIPYYDYYIFTKGDGRFHRCNENGKLGSKGQNRFLNYGTLKREYEIVEVIRKDYEIDQIEHTNELITKLQDLFNQVNQFLEKVRDE